MIPIKIECGCGQRYAFEVEPVGRQMPSAVACPACGIDGTEAANSFISQTLPAPAPVAKAAVRVVVAAAANPSANAPQTGQVDRTRVETEAKAKVSWGDPPKTVLTFLMGHGYGYQEAQVLVKEMFAVRLVEMRQFGFAKIVKGICFMCVPVVAFFSFLKIGFMPMKIMAVAVMVGLWGTWMVLKGTFMVVSPKTEAGDVAEQ